MTDRVATSWDSYLYLYLYSWDTYLWQIGWQPAETEGSCWPDTDTLLDKQEVRFKYFSKVVKSKRNSPPSPSRTSLGREGGLKMAIEVKGRCNKYKLIVFHHISAHFVECRCKQSDCNSLCMFYLDFLPGSHLISSSHSVWSGETWMDTRLSWT